VKLKIHNIFRINVVCSVVNVMLKMALLSFCNVSVKQLHVMLMLYSNGTVIILLMLNFQQQN